MFTSLGDFLDELRRRHLLVEVSAPVNPYLEAAEIHRRVIAEGGPALLFTNIQGSPFPLATNLFGTEERVELAFGPRPEALVREIATLPHELMPPTLSKLWQKRSLWADLAHVGLTTVSDAPITEVIDTPPHLTKLPLLTTWKEDGGPFVTLPLVYTQHPESGVHNLGMYRIHRYDDTRTGFHTQIGKGAGFHLAAAGRLNRTLPVSIAVGGPPALILSAIAPLPENVPELLLASLILRKRVRMVKTPYSPLPVLADAEFVMLGSVDPKELAPEGPFGDHYGYYSLQHDYPVFRCQALLHRRSAVCAATVVGKFRQEDCFLGDYLQRLLSPVFPLVMPAVRDLWSYWETGYHSLAAAVVHQRYKREAMAAAFRILGEGQLSLTKFLLVTDTPMNLREFPRVLEHILARADFRTDLYVFSNLAMDTLDYTGPKVNEGSKGVLLGVGSPIRELPREFSGTLPQGIRRVAAFCAGCLVVEGPNYQAEPQLATRLSTHQDWSQFPLVIIVDDLRTATRSTADFLWTAFTRFEPSADIHARTTSIARNHIAYDYPIVIDARMKPWYPGELHCDPQTSETVSRRWREYFPSTSSFTGQA